MPRSRNVDLTSAAQRSAALRAVSTVARRRALADLDIRSWDIRRQRQAGRWTQDGRAIVLHAGTLTRAEQFEVALANCGPRALLTSFSLLEVRGLTGWGRDTVHVLVPAGVPTPQVRSVQVRLHRTARWAAVERIGTGALHAVAPAGLLAAASFTSPRPACGLLAALVQQRMCTADQLSAALDRAPRLRHRAALRAAVSDIAGGAQALSEIDFVRLCRRHRLPPPRQQSVRTDRAGRRRYLDAEWVLADGRRLVVEVDGALHLAPLRWYDDQLRQNEVVLGGAIVLRYPSAVLRSEERLVVAQLRRLLSTR